MVRKDKAILQERERRFKETLEELNHSKFHPRGLKWECSKQGSELVITKHHQEHKNHEAHKAPVKRKLVVSPAVKTVKKIRRIISPNVLTRGSPTAGPAAVKIAPFRTVKRPSP